ncbi:hypothetical protein SAICODRAFT_70481 [Saitoella complicata NRRL Y-17804]|uniref:RING-type domain-containing protein n=1 Tax=Saitoella complicata (strain BCRC 22490 / CBS 7301 / JCM 7358 / NBRC 10748 / NRRL Y-17804) TaxID=698492 RepID=A0A0E9NR07_SAICN|nr:uncharacterized protein SAICODRAFT_70481 [Saitoella complicata NRRL Y-17804]ODQ54272.1 hypothetical protein SAICODRAFT_70481 [Saitoella complicata NRRL Y-17804]GAO52228.1 hypothetical protein G7K_6310-t1 [Saitoella complicata NRRL Y-17804]
MAAPVSDSSTALISNALASDLVYCAKCFLTAGNGSSFWLTSCGHIVCERCLFPEGVPLDAANRTHTCTYDRCRSANVSIAPLDEQLPQDLIPYFRPLHELIDEFTGAVKFQHGNILRLVEHYRGKMAMQRDILGKVKDELEKARDYKSQIDTLQAENERLRGQLASGTGGGMVQEYVGEAGYETGQKRKAPEQSGRSMGEAFRSSIANMPQPPPHHLTPPHPTPQFRPPQPIARISPQHAIQAQQQIHRPQSTNQFVSPMRHQNQRLSLRPGTTSSSPLSNGSGGRGGVPHFKRPPMPMQRPPGSAAPHSSFNNYQQAFHAPRSLDPRPSEPTRGGGQVSPFFSDSGMGNPTPMRHRIGVSMGGGGGGGGGGLNRPSTTSLIRGGTAGGVGVRGFGRPGGGGQIAGGGGFLDEIGRAGGGMRMPLGRGR